ncbi:hypothetical protein PMI21_02060 [Pseudomonas sp. GM18]|uniref:hypothetical protein n=1 Tax=Pseudomonas sp. GM18 TaxID=1144324 RepID=UPI0002724310|nr:hypothetical protein [Pseudomonas sp. GM18]EJM18488.1 hypothetical protein PMI21_02060 [Pseudomonas sp. GM18]
MTEFFLYFEPLPQVLPQAPPQASPQAASQAPPQALPQAVPLAHPPKPRPTSLIMQKKAKAEAAIALAEAAKAGPSAAAAPNGHLKIHASALKAQADINAFNARMSAAKASAAQAPHPNQKRKAKFKIWQAGRHQAQASAASAPKTESKESSEQVANPSKTLVLWAHGMQEEVFYEPIPEGVGYIPVPPRNYAFTIPFGYALFNPDFTRTPQKLTLYANTFIGFAKKFASRAPFLHLYSFRVGSDEILEALAAVAPNINCDLMLFLDIDGGHGEYITFVDFLNSPVPPEINGEGLVSSFRDKYSSFLLVCCRTNATALGIGLGGGEIGHPDGLYKVVGNTTPEVPITYAAPPEL